mgnify:CR=1 FL=1|jgi:hypothetical protein
MFFCVDQNNLALDKYVSGGLLVGFLHIFQELIANFSAALFTGQM